MLDLNPELVDQEKVRKQKRKRLFKFAAIPCAVLLLGGLFLLRVGVFNLVYASAYAEGNYNTTKDLSNIQLIGNVISPYIAYYDRGVANLKRGIYKDAEQDFRASLRQNPPSEILCTIYVNLSLSVELQGDEKFESKQFDEAMTLYSKAQTILYKNGCANRQNIDASSDKKARDSDVRLDNKRSKTVAKINEENGDDEDGQKMEISDLTEQQEESLKKQQEYQSEYMNKVRQGRTAGGISTKYCTGYCW